LKLSVVQISETRYAQSGDVNIAYRVAGDGPFDIVFVPPAVTNVDHLFDRFPGAGFLLRVASFSRLIALDKRGTGLSDRVPGIADVETRMDDVRAVMDAAGSERAAILGLSEGGPMSLVFGATYPERTHAVVLYGTLPRFTRAPGFPFGPTREEFWREAEHEVQGWGTPELAREWLGEDATDDQVANLAGMMRQGASPGAYRQLEQMNLEIDVRAVLPTIRVPTLVLHRAKDHISFDGARWMAGQIPGARFVEMPGWGHIVPQGDWKQLADEIESFLVPICTGDTPDTEPDTVLATVLFTDIVDSTARAAELGDRRWRELLERHHAAVRQQLARFRGTEMDTAGDGFFARFDGPARGIRCARAITAAVSELGLEVRAGLHTGECELLDGKVAGISVALGARVASKAGPGEVLVSQTVKDLVAGSGIAFEDRGAAELKGVPGEWRLYAVAEAAS
jgi:pimeloyl-ACP methyl ester carboxylesterase/class 3 adenylate cyclase